MWNASLGRRESGGGRWRSSTALCSVAIKLCGRRRSSGASAKLRVSRERRKHESALKTASVVKERNVRLRGKGMRERARRARESGVDGLRKEKYPRCTQ